MQDDPVDVGILTMAGDTAVALELASHLRDHGISCEVHSSSAHRVPNMGQKWLSESQVRGMRVVVAVVGTSSHLINIATASCSLPVVAFQAQSHSGKSVSTCCDVATYSNIGILASAVAELVSRKIAENDES